MDLRSKRGRAGFWATTATVGIITGLWMLQQLQPPELPALPASPMTIRVWLTRPIPPPPPPPPPAGRLQSPSPDRRVPVRAAAPPPTRGRR